jgi:polar amino acid transport system substrate-binding protein
MKKFIAGLAASAIALGAVAATAAEQCTNDVWNKVMQRGKIVVGVKADYKPWGYRNSDGSLVGMEIDMAREVADTLGVEIDIIAVQSSNRMQFLEQGKIDLMIATMSDRKDRRAIVGIVGPNYYTSGTNLLAPDALNFTEWEQIRGKPVCGKQGAFYNQIVEKRYGAVVVAFTGNAEAKQALRDKKCIGFVYDDSSIMADLASGNWEGFGMPMPTEDDNPWALAVPKAEQNCVFGRFMSGMQYNWLKDGTLVELEAKWGIQPTTFLATQKERFKDWLEE